jgi:phage tail sheath gpL-like
VEIDDSDAGYTSVTIKLNPALSKGSIKLTISGTSETTVVPEFPTAMLVIATVFAAITALSVYGKRKGII